jgi:hypothetical protein
MWSAHEAEEFLRLYDSLIARMAPRWKDALRNARVAAVPFIDPAFLEPPAAPPPTAQPRTQDTTPPRQEFGPVAPAAGDSALDL